MNGVFGRLAEIDLCRILTLSHLKCTYILALLQIFWYDSRILRNIWLKVVLLMGLKTNPLQIFSNYYSIWRFIFKMPDHLCTADAKGSMREKSALLIKIYFVHVLVYVLCTCFMYMYMYYVHVLCTCTCIIYIYQIWLAASAPTQCEQAVIQGNYGKQERRRSLVQLIVIG